MGLAFHESDQALRAGEVRLDAAITVQLRHGAVRQGSPRRSAGKHADDPRGRRNRVRRTHNPWDLPHGESDYRRGRRESRCHRPNSPARPPVLGAYSDRLSHCRQLRHATDPIHQPQLIRAYSSACRGSASSHSASAATSAAVRPRSRRTTHSAAIWATGSAD